MSIHSVLIHRLGRWRVVILMLRRGAIIAIVLLRWIILIRIRSIIILGVTTWMKITRIWIILWRPSKRRSPWTWARPLKIRWWSLKLVRRWSLKNLGLWPRHCL
eukprot:NODE_10_length_61504_cov_0.956502.p57 type:complete len:104 gc:universal NODE_10_length_61504_cov_0.956502:36212-35901(-)